MKSSKATTDSDPQWITNPARSKLIDAWNAKQEQLDQPQLDAVNSGITADLVQQIGQSDITGLETLLTGLQNAITALESRIANLELMGSKLGTFPNALSLPTNISYFLPIIPTTKDWIIQIDNSCIRTIDAITGNGDITWGSGGCFNMDLSGKQDLLVSGANIRTIFGQSILGSGNVSMPPASATQLGGIRLVSVDADTTDIRTDEV